MDDQQNTAAEVSRPPRITLLSGGVGGAKFARGMRHHLHRSAVDLQPVAPGTSAARASAPGTSAARASAPGTSAPGTLAPSTALTCIVNTGDDMWLNGLRVCPDLDSVMYGLAGVNDRERGWGRAGETERVSAELLAYGVGVEWFTLGDLDLATHIARTQKLGAGVGLAEVTRRLSSRWDLGATLLPATEQQVETRVRVAEDQVGDGRADDGPADEDPRDTLHFEEWWVRHRAAMPAREFVQAGASAAVPSPGVLEAIRAADLIVLAPSNPIVSIGAILAIPGIREALRSASAPVIGVSPIIGDTHVLGMAAQCLTAVGVEVSAAGVAQHYGARAQGGLLDGWLVDSQDADAVDRVEALGIAAAAVPLLMSSDERTADMAAAVQELAGR